MAEFPILPDDGVIEAGGFQMPCEICKVLIPCPINAFVGEDDDGDEAVFTEIITLDLEMHMLTEHGITDEPCCDEWEEEP